MKNNSTNKDLREAEEILEILYDPAISEEERLDKLIRRFEYGDRHSPSHFEARANLKVLTDRIIDHEAKIDILTLKILKDKESNQSLLDELEGAIEDIKNPYYAKNNKQKTETEQILKTAEHAFKIAIQEVKSTIKKMKGSK